jgi:hypothetical protein
MLAGLGADVTTLAAPDRGDMRLMCLTFSMPALPAALCHPPYLYRVMTQGGSAWALRAREVFCLGVAESAPCP